VKLEEVQPQVDAEPTQDAPSEVDVSVSLIRKAAPDQGTPAGPSSQIRNENIQAMAGAGTIESPPYDLDDLASWPENSTILPQCITALARNIEGHGWHFVSHGWARENVDEAFLKRVDEERLRGERFFNGAFLDFPFTHGMERVRRDIESVGHSGLEYLRSMDGRLAGLAHVRGKTIYMAPRSDTPVEIRRRSLSADGSEWIEEIAWDYPRLYVQAWGNDKVWFKQPGDMRRVRASDGFVLDGLMSRDDWSDPELAHEMLWMFGQYNPNNIYSIPRWVGASPEITGSRVSSETNVTYFDDKAVPPMAVCVSGGKFTPDSKERIGQLWETLKGRDNFHKILLMEAVVAGGGAVKDLLQTSGSNAAPRIQFEKFADLQRGDAHFQAYDANNRNKVRSTCGVPPIVIGETTDYNRATAQVSAEVFDANITGPDRGMASDRINRFIMPELEVLFWKFAFKSQSLTSVEDITKVIEAGAKVGVGSPAFWSEVLERVLGVSIPATSGAWAQVPIALTTLGVQTGALVVELDGDGDGAEIVVRGGTAEGIERLAAKLEDMARGVR
jgi:PBSX family phage portal protein